MSAVSTFGEFQDDKTYSAERLAVLLGRSVRETKAMLRDNFDCADLGGGIVVISGLNWRLGIERLSQSPRAIDDDGTCPRDTHRRRASKPVPQADPVPGDKPKTRPRGQRKPSSDD